MNARSAIFLFGLLFLKQVMMTATLYIVPMHVPDPTADWRYRGYDTYGGYGSYYNDYGPNYPAPLPPKGTNWDPRYFY